MTKLLSLLAILLFATSLYVNSARAACTDGGGIGRCLDQASMWVVCTFFYDCAD